MDMRYLRKLGGIQRARKNYPWFFIKHSSAKEANTTFGIAEA